MKLYRIIPEEDWRQSKKEGKVPSRCECLPLSRKKTELEKPKALKKTEQACKLKT